MGKPVGGYCRTMPSGPEVAPHTTVANARSWRARLLCNGDIAGWLLGAAAAVVLLERFRAPTTFWFDEWNFVLDRHAGGLDSVLEPHNGHLSLLPVLAYRFLFAVVGLDHYRPYRIMGLVTHVTVATMVALYIRARLGSLTGAATGLLVVFLGAGWQNVFWPFQIGMMGSVGFGIAAWLLLDNLRPGDRARSVAVSACLAGGLACSGVGLPFFGATAVRLAVERRARHLATVVLPPALAYGVWYLAYSSPQDGTTDLQRVGSFAVDEGAAAVNGLAGRAAPDAHMGLLLLVVSLLGIALATRRVRAAAVAPAAALAANLVLVAYTRADFGEPDASRYVYVNAVLILLLAGDVLEPIRGAWLEWVLAGAAVLCIWGSWGALTAGAQGLEDASTATWFELRALEWASQTVDPAFQPDPSRMPQVTAARYLDAVAALDSPAASDRQVRNAPEPDRALVDAVSLAALDVNLTATEAIDAEVGGARVAERARLESGTACLIVDGADGLAQIEVDLAAGSSLAFESTSVVEVRLRRFASVASEQPFAVSDAEAASMLSVPVDGAPSQTWIVDLRSAGDLELCGVDAD